jgi:hypothetical protein
MQLSDTDLSRVLGVMLSGLHGLGMTQARRVVSEAGIVGLGQIQHWVPFDGAVESAFFQMDSEQRLISLKIIGNQLSDNGKVKNLLAQHGFEFVDGTFVPTAMLDQREAHFLPTSSASELAKAMKRLVDGDDSGAITAACGAVDTLMQKIYLLPELSGLSVDSSFSTKVNTAIARLNIFEHMESDFLSIGMKPDDAKDILSEMRKATNHSAQMLQILRRAMGDVHGSKPALRRSAYDAIKWSSAICAMFEN